VGLPLLAMNGSPTYKLSESFSLLVHARDQDEVDPTLDRLTADGGRESQCGWLADRFGLTWQAYAGR
jgi:predicted 3-demethylubiquinone-9 3-methyltransferase (glyoxalase superfamily)